MPCGISLAVVVSVATCTEVVISKKPFQTGEISKLIFSVLQGQSSALRVLLLQNDSHQHFTSYVFIADLQSYTQI